MALNGRSIGEALPLSGPSRGVPAGPNIGVPGALALCERRGFFWSRSPPGGRREGAAPSERARIGSGGARNEPLLELRGTCGFRCGEGPADARGGGGMVVVAAALLLPAEAADGSSMSISKTPSSLSLSCRLRPTCCAASELWAGRWELSGRRSRLSPPFLLAVDAAESGKGGGSSEWSSLAGRDAIEQSR